MEGVGFALRHNLEIIRNEQGIAFHTMTIGGGGAKGKLWREIIGNITRTNILLPAILETETLGSALLAGVGCGIYPNLSFAVKAAVKIVEEIPYQKVQAERYDRNFDVYMRLVDHFSGEFDKLAEILP